MMATIISWISTAVIGVSMLFGSVFGPTLAQAPSPSATPTATPPAAQGTLGPAAKKVISQLQQQSLKQDQQVRQGLILSLVSVTGLKPVDVYQGLRDGKSISQLAQSAGKTDADVLAVFNETAQYLANRAEQNHTAASEAIQTRLTWSTQAAQMMIDLPGMAPAFPGLPELRAAINAASLKVSGLDRQTFRSDLQNGQSLSEILTGSGHTVQEAVDAAMQRIDTHLGTLVKNNKLTDAQRLDWSNAISSLLTTLANSPARPAPTHPA